MRRLQLYFLEICPKSLRKSLVKKLNKQQLLWVFTFRKTTFTRWTKRVKLEKHTYMKQRREIFILLSFQSKQISENEEMSDFCWHAPAFTPTLSQIACGKSRDRTRGIMSWWNQSSELLYCSVDKGSSACRETLQFRGGRFSKRDQPSYHGDFRTGKFQHYR